MLHSFLKNLLLSLTFLKEIIWFQGNKSAVFEFHDFYVIEKHKIWSAAYQKKNIEIRLWFEFLFSKVFSLSNSGKYNANIIGNCQMSAVDDMPTKNTKMRLLQWIATVS